MLLTLCQFIQGLLTFYFIKKTKIKYLQLPQNAKKLFFFLNSAFSGLSEFYFFSVFSK